MSMWDKVPSSLLAVAIDGVGGRSTCVRAVACALARWSPPLGIRRTSGHQETTTMNVAFFFSAVQWLVGAALSSLVGCIVMGLDRGVERWS